MTQLILIRHGETLWNTERRMQGQLDSPLTERGLWQARQLGVRLQSQAFTALYSSDLPRATRTVGPRGAAWSSVWPIRPAATPAATPSCCSGLRR